MVRVARVESWESRPRCAEASTIVRTFSLLAVALALFTVHSDGCSWASAGQGCMYEFGQQGDAAEPIEAGWAARVVWHLDAGVSPGSFRITLGGHPNSERRK
jgi:hypothetical protein